MQLPARLGPYRVGERLGAGAMGVVHRGRHQVTGVEVALKTVAVPREGHLASLRREIQALSRIDHPGVVRIVAHGVEAGLPWCAMELVEGVALSELPRDAALAALARCCEALAFLHGEGIVHRDLKPANLLVRADGSPVLVDLGLTRWFAGEADSRDGLEMAAGRAGSLSYLAPEVLAGELADARADLYALGCMLYEVLTGVLPFTGATVAEVARRVQGEAARAPSLLVPELGTALDGLVLGLLEKAPRARLGHAEDVGQVLGQWLRGRGASTSTSTSTSTRAPARAFLFRPPFVGRGAAVAEVEAALQRSPVLLVGGESGIGKTRVALEVARHAEARGAHVLTGHCPAPIQGSAGALEPLRAPLLAIADRCREWGAAEAARILGPRAARLAPYQPALAELGPRGAPHAGEHARERLIEDLVATLCALAEDAPLLLVLDDLQWADGVTLELVVALHRAGARSGVEVLGLYRAEAVGPTLAATLAELGPATLALGRLDEAAVGEMAAGMLALPSAPPAFARFLSQQSEGSPFFVAEYLRVAVAEGVLTRSAGTWRLPDGALGDAALTQLPLPGTLRQLVARRLDGLSMDAQVLASLIAVLGRRVELDLVAELCPAELDLLGATSELVARVTLEDDGTAVRFAHDRLREGAYARLSPAERVRLHGAAASALSRPARRTRDTLPALAQHQERAGDPLAAIATYVEAATLSRELGAYVSALEFSERALAVAGAPPAAYHLARVRRVDLLGVLCRYDEADAEIATVLDDEARLDPVVRARAHGAAALLGSVRGRVAEAVRHGQLAVASVPAGAHDLRFKMTNLYAQALAAATQLEAAAEQLRIAAGAAAALDDPELIAAAHSNLGIVLRRTGDPDGAEAAFTHAISAARRLPEHPMRASPLCNLARLCVQRGDSARARTLLAEATPMAQASGQLSVLANAHLILAEAAFRDGDLDATTTLARQALAQTPKPLTRGDALRLLGRIALARADHATAARELAASLDIMTTLGERDYEAETVLALADLASAQGDPARAATLRTRARDLYLAAGLPRRAAAVAAG